MKQKFMEKGGQRATVDVESGSVKIMEEQGWMVVGDAPDAPDPAEVEAKQLMAVIRDFQVPAWLRTNDVLETVLMELKDLSAEDAEAFVTDAGNVFGELFNEEHAKWVRSKVKAPVEEKGADPDYAEMTKAQIKELLDAKGVAYEEKDNKDKLVDRLKASKNSK